MSSRPHPSDSVPVWPALRRMLLALLMPLLAAPVLAQRQPLPEAVQRRAAEHTQHAELATSAWSRQDLSDWWRALRALDGSDRELPAHLRPPSEAAAWRPVSLPDVRQRRANGELPDGAGGADYQMRWYRLRYEPPDGHWPTSVALYMPRLVTLAAAVLVRTDHGWRPVFDNQAGAREQWVRPLWAAFPGSLTDLHEDRVIEVVLAVPVMRDSFYAVSSARLGAREDLEPQYKARWAMQIGVPQATGLLLVVLGLFAFTLWLRRRTEPAYLLFALAAVAWLVRNLHYHIDMPRTRLGLEWFWWVTHASMAWVMMLTFLFALRFASRRFPLFERAMGVFVLLSSLATMPLWMDTLDPLVLQHMVNAAVGALGTGFVAWVAWHEEPDGGHELRLIALCLALALGLGVHDLGLLAGWGWSEHIYLMPFATLVIVASFLYAVQRRYLGALRQVEQSKGQLVQRLAQQGEELRAKHEQLSEVERQQALLLERQRLMQDMHDGLGSSLLSAMVAVEQGSMSQDQVVGVLRECVDDLRLVIDSLEPVGHDLVSLLATMRYRLGKRLQAGGLVLDWDVQDLPPLEWLEPPDALHVLRLLQEALNNVLKHARASRVRIATRDLGSKVEIRVEDDGQGFDLASAKRGRGLRGQQKRAQRLGGSVHVDSQPGHGTQLSLRLPVKRKPQPPEPAAAD